MPSPDIDFAIIMTSGPDTPKRLASPFFLAATAAAEDMAVVVYFTGLGTLLLKRDEAEKLYAKEGGKSVREFMDLARKNGAQFVACAMSMDLHDMKAEDLAFDIPMVGVAEALPYLQASKKLVSF